MIRTLNMIDAGIDVPLAGDKLKFSRMMLIEDIEEHPDFKVLYRIDKEVLERIEKSMKEKGFDGSQPVHIWVTKDSHHYLIDGYTRFTASRNAGITFIPVYEHDFPDFEEAYRYVLGLQVNRRNLDGDELLRNVEVLLKCDSVKDYEGVKADHIATSLGVSRRTAQRALSVQKNADDHMRKRIEDGKLTVNQAYKELHEGKKGGKKRSDEEVRFLVWRTAMYVIAEVINGFDPKLLIDDEDFKSAVEYSWDFEIPECDIRVLEELGVEKKKIFGDSKGDS